MYNLLYIQSREVFRGLSAEPPSRRRLRPRSDDHQHQVLSRWRLHAPVHCCPRSPPEYFPLSLLLAIRRFQVSTGMISDSSSALGDGSGSGNGSAHADLHRLRSRLQEILETIDKFESPIRLPPVLDVSFVGDDPSRPGGARPAGEIAIPGLRGLEESIRRDFDVLTKVSSGLIQDAPASGFRSPLISSSWMILRTRNFHRCRQMRHTSWPCGMKFWPHLHPWLGFGVHFRIQEDAKIYATTYPKPARRNKKRRMLRLMS